jgi:hypothetical protein
MTAGRRPIVRWTTIVAALAIVVLAGSIADEVDAISA